MSDNQTLRDGTVLHRIECEFREMPGLNLTPDQGARLWCVPRGDVVDLLNRLVERGVLRRSRVGTYVLV
jgi:hypothetical protein